MQKKYPFAAPEICKVMQPAKEVATGELYISNLPIETINHITSYLEHISWGWGIKINNDEPVLTGLDSLENNQTPEAD